MPDYSDKSLKSNQKHPKNGLPMPDYSDKSLKSNQISSMKKK